MAFSVIQKICLSMCLWRKHIHDPNLSLSSARPIPTCSGCQKEKLDYRTVLSFYPWPVGSGSLCGELRFECYIACILSARCLRLTCQE